MFHHHHHQSINHVKSTELIIK